MSHPYLLLTAVAVTAPLLVPLVRVFFGTWAQFADETGLRSGCARNHPDVAWSKFSTHVPDVVSTALLDLLGLFLAYAAVLAIAYHVLVWIGLWFDPAG